MLILVRIIFVSIEKFSGELKSSANFQTNYIVLCYALFDWCI